MSNGSTPPCVLVVEDDDQVRGLIEALLANEGYRLMVARTGTEALDLAASGQCTVDLLVSDMLLPGVSGYDLAVTLRERFPHMKVILMTGYVEGEIVQRCIAELGATFLDKPFQPAVLRRLIRDTAGDLRITEQVR
ncbi:MAG TPA: response regulator [Bryobacteraceae bacterium]|nr:response regulator [Bryobacteraceae bacterium]